MPYSNELSNYYRNHFPCRAICSWLGYGEIPVRGTSVCDFKRREFSIRYKNNVNKNEVFRRFLGFSDEQEFKENILHTQNDLLRIDLGAIWEGCPSSGYAIRGNAVRKEFILDIDLTDMHNFIFTKKDEPNDPSFQCSWKFLRIAMYIIDQIFEFDFGFTDILRVFSGRRGIHYWVCDERVMGYNNVIRSAIIRNISLSKRDFEVNFEDLHPSLIRASKIILKDKSAIFCEMIEEQGWFMSENIDFVLSSFKDRNLASILKTNVLKLTMSKNTTRKGKFLWGRFCSFISEYINTEQQCFIQDMSPLHKKKRIQNCIWRFALWMVYPILDVKVSERTDHLLKVPFSVHPSTGMICVPTNAEMVHPPLLSVSTVCNNPAVFKEHVKRFWEFAQPLYICRMKKRIQLANGNNLGF